GCDIVRVYKDHGISGTRGRDKRPAFDFLLRSDTVEGDTRVPHNASVISSTRRTDTPARYISISASSTELSRRRYRSMIAVSNVCWRSFGTLNRTSPALVCRPRS